MKRKGREFQLTSQMGEYLVAVELGRRGYICTTFTQNVPDFDIIAIDESLKRSIPIQVKTMRKGGSFQSRATQWMDIEFEGELQKIVRKKPLAKPKLIYVMVELGERYGEDSFFVLRMRELQNLYYHNYKQWLEKCGGRRPRKPESLHNAIWPRHLEKYRDNWKILKEEQ